MMARFRSKCVALADPGFAPDGWADPPLPLFNVDLNACQSLSMIF